MKQLLDPTGRPVRDEAGLIVYEETPLVTTPGLAKGLNPIEESIDEDCQTPGKVCSFFGDHMRRTQRDIIPPQEWGPWIEKGAGNLKHYVWHIYNQRQVGSCGAEDVKQNLTTRRRIGGQKNTKLNAYGMYWYTSGGRDQGSSHPDNLKYAREHGCPSQAVRPRSKGWSAKPTEEERADAKKYRLEDFYEVRTVEEFGSALLYGFSLVCGYSGHSVCAVQLVNTLQFVYANSWDESWGDNGFGVLRFSSLYWGYGVYAVEAVTDSGDN